MEDVGRKIREIRKRHKDTLTLLAGKLNIDKAHLSRMETGKSPINIEMVKKIAVIYDVPASYFFEEELNKDEQDLMNDLDLTDDELIEKYNLVIDGKKVSKQEVKMMLSVIRGMREQ